jgi:hypothetical protein
MDQALIDRQRDETLASLTDHYADATRRGDTERADQLADAYRRISGQEPPRFYWSDRLGWVTIPD